MHRLVCVGPGRKTPKTGFLASWLNLLPCYSNKISDRGVFLALVNKKVAHNESMSMQYTELFLMVKIEKFLKKIIFLLKTLIVGTQ